MSEHDDFLEGLNPENWTETTTLHTPSLEATLDGERLSLLFPDGQRWQLERSDVEALTRFLDQYAGVEPLPEVEDPFPQGWQPTRVEGVCLWLEQKVGIGKGSKMASARAKELLYFILA